MADTLDGSWPHMAQLASAGINPATLEAFRGESIPEVPDLAFFESAVTALRAAQKELKVGFERLGMERKVALVDLILQAGADKFSRTFKKPDTRDGAAVVRAIEQAAALLGTRKRTLESITGNLLVFEDQAINDARARKLELPLGYKGPVVCYVHRLLQVAQRLLKLPAAKPTTFDVVSVQTTNALTHFQTKVFKSSQEGSGLDPYTLALLECIVCVTEPDKGEGKGPRKPERGMGIINQKEHLLKITPKDFDAFFDLYTRIQLFTSAPSWVVLSANQGNPPPLLKPPEMGDLASLKYVLGFMQEENKDKIDELQKLFKKAPDSIKEFLREVWESGWLGKTGLSLGGAAAGLALFWGAVKWGDKVAKGDVDKIDAMIIEGAGSLFEMVKFETKDKRDGGLRYKRNETKLKGGLTGPGKEFKSSSGKPVEGLGGGGELSFTWTRNKSLAPEADLATLTEHGFNDKRVWYCEATHSCHPTYELRTLFQEGKLSGDAVVIDITSKERKQEKVSAIPVVASPDLFSNKEKGFSLTTGVKGQYVWDPQDQQHLLLVGGKVLLETGGFSMGVTGTYRDVRAEYPANSNKLVAGFVSDLEATLKYKWLLGANNKSRTNALEFWASLKDSQTIFANNPQLNSRILVTTGGARWNVVRKDDFTFSMSLLGTYPLEQINVAKPQTPSGTFRLEGFGRDFSMSIDGTFRQGSAPLWSLRLVKQF